MSHSFDLFVLIISIPSEISILSYSNINNSQKHYLLPSLKTDLTAIVKEWSFSILLKGKLSSELSLIFMYSFSCSPASPLLIALV